MYEFGTYASNDMIMPGMLNVVNEFHAPVEYVSLSLTVYILGNSLLQLFLGPLSERYGKRIVILIGVTLFMIFTIFLVMASNILEFMFGRLLQGSSVAYVAMGYALVHEKFNDKQSVKIMSLMGNVSLLAPLIGPVMGVAIIQLSSWRYVFIITGVLAFISFIGLYMYTPKDIIKPSKINIKNTIKSYIKILCTPQFIVGTVCVSLGALTIMSWIGLAPTIIIKTLNLPMKNYAIYQLIAIGGLSLSTIVMHITAGRFSFNRLLKGCSGLVFLGLTTAFIFNSNINIVVFAMFLSSFGVGIFNTLAMRLVMTVPNLPQGLITSLMVFILTTILAFGLELANHVISFFNYSLYGFTVINFVTGCIFIILANIYAHMNKNKSWN
jgi:DHA1 family multidrug/chloramphenicol efflux transport protein-like MFS transporter